MPRHEVKRRIATVEEERRDSVKDLFEEVDDDDFWTSPRIVQVQRMLARKDAYQVLQTDIATILGIDDARVTHLKQQLQENPDGTRRRPGRPSQLSDVFPLLENFIDEETRARRAVTMSVLMAFLSDIITEPLTKKRLRTFMKRHHYTYKNIKPTDVQRLTVTLDDMTTFYTRTLPEAINGIHPALVFNVDEMGAEMFADRKRVYVFARDQDVLNHRNLQVGVPRSTRRCTLIAGIALDGTKLGVGLIAKTMTISSVVFAEGGYMSDRIRFYHTDNSFMNNDVFGLWITDVLIPEIERRRADLREKIGTYDERAVLIMDGLKCHTMEPIVELLRRHNVTVLLLVAHSSHMTQPLDVGIFGLVKNLIREGGKYVINLRVLDRALAEQTEDETAGREIPRSVEGRSRSSS